MSLRRPQSSSLRGFTLVEILVICALIAILSSIAIFQVKQVMDQARLKATYPDMRGVADSLSSAHIDLGFFPKIGYLPRSAGELIQLGNPLPEDFDAMGFPTSTAIGPMRAKQIMDNWNGPYYNAAGGRSTLKTGTSGYTVEMQMPHDTKGNLSSSGPLVDWPADPWGQPYVVYLVNQPKPVPDPNNPGKFLGAPPPHFVHSPYEEPSYLAILVSYGPNKIPGGSGDAKYYEPVVEAIRADPTLDCRLFHPAPGPDPFRPSYFVALTNDELTTSRLRALSMNSPFLYSANLFPSVYPPVPGILDGGYPYPGSVPGGAYIQGSDDIIVPIR